MITYPCSIFRCHEPATCKVWYLIQIRNLTDQSWTRVCPDDTLNIAMASVRLDVK